MGLFKWLNKTKILSKSEYEHELKNFVVDPDEFKLRSFIYCILTSEYYEKMFAGSKSSDLEEIVDRITILIEKERTNT